MRKPEAAVALSPAQEGILFESLTEPGAYVQQLTCTVRGELDMDAFAAAWRHCTRRHEALRASFTKLRDGRPVQLLHADAEPPIAELDWRRHDQATQERLWRELLASDRAAGFRLAVPPLSRLHVVRTGADRRLLLWSVHHILVDGWSAGLVLSEVLAAHAAAREGRAPDLPPAGRYADYLDWVAGQDESAAREALAERAEALRDAPPLPRDGRRGDRPRAEREVARVLPAARAAALGEAARGWGLPRNALLQAGWAIVLARFTGAGGVAFGLTVTQRPSAVPRVATTAGLFVNTLPVVAACGPERALRDVAAELHRTAGELQAHAHVSAASVRQWCELPPQRPVFDSMLVFEEYLGHDTWWRQDPALEVGDIAFHGQTNAPCTALVAPTGDGLRLRLMADARLFDQATCEAIADDWLDVLTAIAAAPGATVGELCAAASSRGRRQQARRNETARPLPEPATIPALLAGAVERFPDAVAVEDGETTLTYAELDRRSAAAAASLARHGVGRGTPVPFLAAASADAIVALLGVVRAGGHYVPLEAGAPAARVAEIVERLGARLAVADAPGAVPPGVVHVHPAALAGSGALDPPPAIEPADPAYAIFTSGSTGRPKGVVVPHRAVVRLVHDQRYAPVGPGVRVAQLSTLAFDAATFEVFGALLTGGTLVVLGTRALLDPAALTRALAARSVDVAFLTTAVFNAVADAAPAGLGACSTILFGGEAVDPDRVRAVRDATGTALVHVYGPTEATTFATAHRVESVDPHALTVPIGDPIANTTAWVLGAGLNPLPFGAVGELCIGGPGVAAYLEGETPPRFVPDPFAAEPGARLYRTGDLARWTPRGIEFGGRRDHQVKLRGFRIELGEVEAALRGLDGVADATVVVCGEGADRRLAGYVLANGDGPEPAAAAAALRRTLPAYMVPSTIVALREWPVTPSGKIDRRRLEREAAGDPAARRLGEHLAGGERAAPPARSAAHLVAEVFASVLDRPAVGLDERFFEAGGHSLLAVRVVGRLRELDGAALTVVDLFDNPTPRQLGALLEAQRAGR